VLSLKSELATPTTQQNRFSFSIKYLPTNHTDDIPGNSRVRVVSHHRSEQ